MFPKFGLNKNIDPVINKFSKYFWEIRKGTNRPIVIFVSLISILQNIQKISTFYTVIDNFRESLRVYMNRVDHDFN